METGVPPAVLGAARAGDGRAFEEVFRALAPAVHGYLRAQGSADAEGTANEVFLRVHRRLADFDGDSASFRSWVFVIAHNLLADERRRRARRPLEEVVATAPDRSGRLVTEDEAIERLSEARLQEVLATLSPDQRDVALLRFVADLSLEQVAEATGRSVGAVKALQRRALDALRRSLRDRAPVDAEAGVFALPVSPRAPRALTVT